MKLALARRGARLAFEQLPDSLLLLDPGDRVLEMNAAAARLLCAGCALPPGGAPLVDLGAAAAQLASALPRSVPGSVAVVPVSLRAVAQGQFEVHVNALCAEDGELLLRIVRLADVTAARRDAERLEQARVALAAQVDAQTVELKQLADRLSVERHQLALAEERLLAIEDIAGIGHWSWDARGGELNFSPGAMRIVSLQTSYRAIGQGIDLGTVLEPDHVMLQARFVRIAAGEVVPAVRFGVQVPGEEKPRCFFSPPPAYEYEDGRVLRAIGLLQDISSGEETAARLEQMNRELETEVEARTHELAAIARRLEGFAYMATHELRAPLRAINGHAAIALEECAGVLGPESLVALAEIVRLANQLDALIDDLRVLAVDAAAAPVRQRIDLAPIAHRLVRDWARGSADGVPRLATPESLPVELDPVRGPLLWRHLLNAVCAASVQLAPGGELRIARGPGGRGVLVQGSFAADAIPADPLIAHLLRRMGLRLVPRGAGALLLDAAAADGA